MLQMNVWSLQTVSYAVECTNWQPLNMRPF